MTRLFPLRHSLPALWLVLGGLLAIALIADGIRNANQSTVEEARRQLQAMGAGTVARLECCSDDSSGGVERWRMAVLNCEPSLLESSIFDATNRLLARFGAESARSNRADTALLNLARISRNAQIQPSRDRDFLSGAFPFRLGSGKGASEGVAYLEMDLRPEKDLQLVRNFRRSAVICLLTLAVVGLSWAYLNRTFTRRAGKFIAAARDIAGGDLARRVSLAGRDEFAELGAAFNQMAAQIQARAQALAESEERYRRIVETAYEGMFALDADHRLTFVNRRLAEMLGYTMDTMTGLPLEDFLFEEDWPDQRERLTRRQFSEASRYERRLRRDDGGEVRTLMSSSVARDDSGNIIGAFGMVTDITGRRELESELHEAQSTEGGVAHGFNNLITVVIGYAQFLKMSPSLTPSEQTMVGEISNAGRRATDLTRQLQRVGRTCMQTPKTGALNGWRKKAN